MNIETFVEDCLRIIIAREHREAQERADAALQALLRPPQLP